MQNETFKKYVVYNFLLNQIRMYAPSSDEKNFKKIYNYMLSGFINGDVLIEIKWHDSMDANLKECREAILHHINYFS